MRIALKLNFSHALRNIQIEAAEQEQQKRRGLNESLMKWIRGDIAIVLIPIVHSLFRADLHKLRFRFRSLFHNRNYFVPFPQKGSVIALFA